MHGQEKKRISYLVILICFTFLAAALGAEILLRGWEKAMVVQLLVELVVCWGLQFTGKAPEPVKKWLFFALAMHGYVYYGVHETSLYALAPLMTGIMLLFFATEIYDVINLCALVFAGTLACNLLFVSGKTFAYTRQSVVSLVSQCIFVCLAAHFTRLLREKNASERKDIQNRIAKLEEENHRTEDFLTNVSHELRTPINAVTGLTAIMLKNEEDAARRENLTSIQQAGYRLFGQIEDILDYTEIDTGKISISEDAYMLSSLINDIVTDRHTTNEKEGLELIFDVEATIPSVLTGDSRKVKKILRHLLDNAIKFTEEGGIYVRIYALPKSYGINLCMQVKDTGIGMNAESLSKITERFYQSSEGRDRRAGGLGLGLPIVYGMVSAMGGFVHVESHEGSGTTVTVSIPQKIADDTPGMSVENPSDLCLACYLFPEKYKVSEVRTFYDEMIRNMARGLDISVHRVFNMDELETLVSRYRLTHLFLAKEEYEADTAYFENLDKEIQVILVVDKEYTLKEGSRVRLLHKPFYCFPIVNILNAAVQDDAAVQGLQMICPDVRALIVDDEPMNRMVAEGILKDYQMEVKTAGSGMEAVSMCEKEEFDLLFLDHMMPEMDGIETLKQIRKKKTGSANTVTAIAFTANAVSGAREMFLREGFDDFLSKPVETPELEHVLRKVLPKARIQFVERKEKTTPPGGKTPAQSGQEPEENEETRLAKAGMNVAAALGYCRNDREFYLQLLAKFVSDAAGKEDEIGRFYEKKEYENYRIQVHALKSTSKMMGADQLSQSAKDMESAVKENNTAYIEAHHGELLAAYEETVQAIRQAIGVPDSADEASEAGGMEITREELLGQLEEIRKSFDTFEADRAQKLMEELKGTVYNGRSVRTLLEDIKREVEDFEYEAASEKTVGLIARVEGGEV